jgi:hypothetical protein
MPQISAPPVGVYLNGKLTDGVHVLSCSFGKGSAGLATAELVFATTGQNQGHIEVENIELAKFEQPSVEIVIAGDSGDRVIWCGDILARHYSLSEVTCTARVEDYHFGLPLKKSWYWNPKSSQPISLHLPTIFNPELDGLIWPNCSQKKHPKLAFNLFLHPESQQTDKAKEYAGSTKPTLWTLAEAVFYLCQSLNSGQLSGGQDVGNPTLAELFSVLGEDDSLLRNYEAPFGVYLPEQLDRLLEPFGFGWTVDCLARGKRKIRVFARGKGKSAGLGLQPSGESVKAEKTNVAEISLSADVSSGVSNFLTVVGDFKRFERVFYLQKAWKSEYDSRNLQDLWLDTDTWKETPELSRVWRDWVLNEAGDYNGLRDEITKPYDFDELFGQGTWVARRRAFLPCLSVDADGAPRGQLRGVYIEWSADGGGANAEWKPVEHIPGGYGGIALLARECGIRFVGLTPPAFFNSTEDASKCRIRVTACVESDERVEILTDRKPSLLSRAKREYINAGRKFKFKQVSPNSPFLTRSNGTDRQNTAVDDSLKIAAATNELVKSSVLATVGGDMQLVGIDHDESIAVGSTVPKIIGRGIGLHSDPAGNMAAQIVGLAFDFQGQKTSAVIDTYRGSHSI